MELNTGMGIAELAKHVLMGRRVLMICMEELEWKIREKYCDKMPTTRSRIRGYVKKHIGKLKQRDSLFDEYFSVMELVEKTYETGHYAIQVFG